MIDSSHFYLISILVLVGSSVAGFFGILYMKVDKTDFNDYKKELNIKLDKFMDVLVEMKQEVARLIEGQKSRDIEKDITVQTLLGMLKDRGLKNNS